MDKLSMLFTAGDVLYATSLNSIVDKINEIIDGSGSSDTSASTPNRVKGYNKISGISSIDVVDLGNLGKWGKYELGSESSTLSGDFFTWSDVVDGGTVSNDRRYIGGDSSLDIVRRKLGGKWRLPTYMELYNLFTHLTRKEYLSNYNNANGDNVLPVVYEAPNGNTITLPQVGYYEGDTLKLGSSYAIYWSANMDTQEVYVSGVVSKITNCEVTSGSNGYIQLQLSDNGSQSTTQLYITRLSNIDGQLFTISGGSQSDISVGDSIVVKGSYSRQDGHALMLAATLIRKQSSTLNGYGYGTLDAPCNVRQLDMDAQLSLGKTAGALSTGFNPGLPMDGWKPVSVMSTLSKLKILPFYDDGSAVVWDADYDIQTLDSRAVDLGLPSGTLWASCNIGATHEYEVGSYFAYGEVTPHASGRYLEDDYQYAHSGNMLGALKRIEQYVILGGGHIQSTEYDAAKHNWGDKWMIPTNQQMWELMWHASWELTTSNGVAGYKVTSKQEGNDSYIFLPMTGVKMENLVNTDKGYYWSDTLAPYYPYEICKMDKADYLRLDGGQDTTDWYTHYGMPIRAVFNKNWDK